MKNIVRVIDRMPKKSVSRGQRRRNRTRSTNCQSEFNNIYSEYLSGDSLIGIHDAFGIHTPHFTMMLIVLAVAR